MYVLVCQLTKTCFFFLADCPTQDINAWCSPISVSVGFENGVWALSKMDKNSQKQPKTVILPVLWIVLSSLVGIVTDLPLPQVVVRSVSCDIPGYRVSSWGTSNLISYKAELLQLKPHPFICMRNFINKKVGNRKKLRPLLLYQFYTV